MNPISPPPFEAGQRFDWQGAYERLDRATSATEEALGPTPEQALAVMDERARVLARVPVRPPGPSETLEIATFTLASERYAIETRFIAKVVRLSDFTPVPGSPDFLGGVLNLRGEILALVDLRAFLGIAGSGFTDLSRIIVLGLERNEFGIMADSVHEVTTLRLDEIFDPPASIPGSGRPYLRGVTADARIILDGAALIRDEGLFIDQSDELAPGSGS